VSLSRVAACSCAREARVKDRASARPAWPAPQASLDAGDRAPIIRAAGKGHAAAGRACSVVAAPWPACGRAGPRACIHPFAGPRHACRGAWGGYAAGRAGSITRAPALPGRRQPVPGGGSTLHGLAPGRGPGPGHAACPGRLARRMCPSRMPLDRLGDRPAQDPRALLGHVPLARLGAGLAVARVSAAQLHSCPGPGKRRMSPISATRPRLAARPVGVRAGHRDAELGQHGVHLVPAGGAEPDQLVRRSGSARAAPGSPRSQRLQT